MKPIPIKSFPATQIVSQNEKLLYFGGTAYLGLQGDESFQDILINNIRQYGTSYGSSRNANVRFRIFEEAEGAMAKWFGYESAITLSSGYLAGQLVCQYLQKEGHRLIALPSTHPAIRATGTTTVVNNIESFQKELLTNDADPRPTALFIDSIDFHGAHFPEFEYLSNLPLDNTILVVDDSHGFGVTGRRGQGSIVALEKLGAKELIVCGSMNKALALQAGVVLGRKPRINKLRESSIVSSGSPPAPALLATFLEARDLYTKKHAQLAANEVSFRSQVEIEKYFYQNRGHPVFSFGTPDLARKLTKSRILFTSFQYPDPDGPKINRIVLTADHTSEQLSKLARIINSTNHPLMD